MKARLTGRLGNRATVEVGGQSNTMNNAAMLEVVENLLANGIDVEVVPGTTPSGKIGDMLHSDLLDLTEMSFGDQARALKSKRAFTIKARS